MMWIALTGRARVGKDTAADILCERHGFERYAFADPIRQGLAAMLGLTIADFEFRKDVAIEGLEASPRRLMQTLGTEWGRQLIHPDIWLLAADAALCRTPRGRVVITDCRFENEARWVRAHGGYVLRITRQAAPPVESHISEAGIPGELIDGEVANDGDIEALASQLSRVAFSLGCRLATAVATP